MSSLCRKSLHAIALEAEEAIRKFEADRTQRLKGRVYRPLFGVRVSRDYGQTWKLHALCDECKNELEPPVRAINEGSAGSLTCDWCGALNEK